jgi:hypothetical protein
MIYDHLGQDATMTATTSTTSTPSRTFFQRMFPTFFPIRPIFQPRYTFVDEGCRPTGALPAGTLGRDANGNLTINGQTWCQPRANYAPSYGIPSRIFY